MLSLLLDKNNKQISQLQKEIIEQKYSKSYEDFEKNIPIIKEMNKKDKFFILKLSLPTLKNLKNEDKKSLISIAKEIINKDNKVELFEWAMYKILLHGLEINQYSNKLKDENAALFFLQTLISEGSEKQQQEIIYKKACEKMGLTPSPFIPQKAVEFSKLEDALYSLENAKNGFKQKLLEASCYVITYDEKINEEEFILMQSFCYLLSVPLPELNINFSK